MEQKNSVRKCRKKAAAAVAAAHQLKLDKRPRKALPNIQQYTLESDLLIKIDQKLQNSKFGSSFVK